MNPDTDGFAAWQASGEGKRCIDISTLQGVPNAGWYLENRLRAAFEKGAASAESARNEGRKR